MAIPEKTKNRSEALIDEVNDSKRMMPGDKDIAREVLIEARNGTNGLTLEQKVAHNAETLFNLTYLVVRMMLQQAERVSSWKDVVVNCSWQITIVLIGLFILIAIHPELGGLLTQINK